MKTLGQIAFEAYFAACEADVEWSAVHGISWETAAKAVAAAVRTECLAAVESRFLLGETKYAVNMAHDEAVGQCADAIRYLALEAK